MWHNHPLGQRNKKTDRAVGVGVVSDRGEGVGQNLKKGDWQYRGLGSSANKETDVFHTPQLIQNTA